MTISNPRSKSRIFDSLPQRVQSAIAAYAELAKLSPDAVITLAIAHFLELESIPLYESHRYTETDSILDDLPACLRIEIENYAAEGQEPRPKGTRLEREI